MVSALHIHTHGAGYRHKGILNKKFLASRNVTAVHNFCDALFMLHVCEYNFTQCIWRPHKKKMTDVIVRHKPTFVHASYIMENFA
jgi:hypothetical protein